MSAPTGPGGASVAVSGTVTFSGLTVELWDGQAWRLVANAPTTAAIEVADGAATATLMPASQIPAGQYSKVRLTANEVTGDLAIDLDGLHLEATFRTEPGRSLTIERTIQVTTNPDGSSTFRLELQLVRSVTLAPGSVILAGDLGAVTAAATVKGSVVATDASPPVAIGPDGRPMAVSGNATFSGLRVELWDGQSWRTVVDGDGGAAVELADGSASATLVPAGDLPAGNYGRIRVGATEARIDLTLTMEGGEELHASFAASGEAVIEKSVEVIANADGSRTIRVTLELVRSIVVNVDPGNGAATVTINGDIGSATAPAARR